MKDSRRQPNEDYLGDYSRFMEISRKWSELIENVSRLNWFLRLRKELVAHL